MGRFRRYMYEEYRHEFSTDESYNLAYRKVKRIKGFYSHLKVYIIVNVIIIISGINRNVIGDFEILTWHTFSTAACWGVFLLAHGLSVFGRDLFFNDDWEQKKIQEYIAKEKANANKWK